MKIGMIGAGNVGGVLGRRLAEAGYDVTFGVRDPAKGAASVKGGTTLPDRASVAAPVDAVRGADVVIVSTPWSAVGDALRDAGADEGVFDGVVLIDATNPVAPGLTLDTGTDGASGAERIQAMVPGARVVKAFNTTGFENMRNPVYDGAPTAMFYAGNDAAAKIVVRELVAALGFEPVDAGKLDRARELERVAILWISLSFGANGAESLERSFAFRLVRR